MKKLNLILIVGAVSMTIMSSSAKAQQDSIWTLQMCIRRAYDQNIQIRKSQVSNQQSALYADQAKAQRMPSLNGSVSQNFDWSKSNSTVGSGYSGVNGTNLSLNSGLVLFNASKLNNQIKQADLQVEAGNWSLETTKETIGLSIFMHTSRYFMHRNRLRTARSRLNQRPV
jgi:outer membrane protein